MGHRSRHAGNWRTTTQPWVRHGGTWRQATAAWIRQGGAWVKWWPDLPDRGGPYLFGSIASCGPNICRYDGSVWVSVGGGISTAVGFATVNDGGKILASIAGSTSKFWNGSAWSTLSPSFYNTNTSTIATDGTDLFISRLTPGLNPTTIWRCNASGSITVERYINDNRMFQSASISAMAWGQFCGYLQGSFDDPALNPIYLDAFGGYSTYTILSSFVMARQLDGNVWTGPSAGGVIGKENGSANTWTQIGGTVTGGAVRAICALPDGRAWVGGDFTAIGGTSIAGIAQWNGSAWVQVGAGLAYVAAMAYHQDKLWILSGATATARKVYTWDGTTLALHSDWTGETVVGLI